VICPKCGAHTWPGCNDPNCTALWCERVSCGWENNLHCQEKFDEVSNLELEAIT